MIVRRPLVLVAVIAVLVTACAGPNDPMPPYDDNMLVPGTPLPPDTLS